MEHRRGRGGKSVAKKRIQSFGGGAGCTTDVVPPVVGTIAETEAAQLDTFDRANQGAFAGVDFIVLSRMAYNHLGDQKLYAYYRNMRFDSCGKLSIISGELRVTIDTPEECP